MHDNGVKRAEKKELCKRLHRLEHENHVKKPCQDSHTHTDLIKPHTGEDADVQPFAANKLSYMKTLMIAILILDS